MPLLKIVTCRKFTMFLLFLFNINVVLFAIEFPLRNKYSDVPVYSVEQLKQDFGKVIIVDVRTRFEYNIVKINGALHNSVTLMTFIDRLKSIRNKKGDKKIVFYCNGHTCSKSYKATAKAMKAGYKNVYAYDAGVFTWVKKHPELASLLGQSPVHQAAIIKKNTLQAKMLNYSKFREAASQSNSLVIDIRDPRQRKVRLGLLGKEIYLDRFVHFLKRGTWKDRQLLIYDSVGKQVRWLQYVLMANGYTNYYFLEKGVRGTVSVQANK